MLPLPLPCGAAAAKLRKVECVSSRPRKPVELASRPATLLAALRERSANGYSRLQRVGQPRAGRPQAGIARRLLTTALAFSLLLAGSALALTGFAYHHLNGNIARVDVLQKKDGSIRDAAKQPNAENFLIIGSDSRAGDMHKYGSDVAGERSDTTMLIHLSPDRSRAIGISIPRDAWVQIPDCSDGKGGTVRAHMEMFNSAITTGGPACTIATVQKLTGIEVTHYIDVNFDGFKTMVNALGTVTICSPEKVNDPGSGLKLVKGNNVLNGDQALAYVRARETLGDGSDLGRIKRQQRFLGVVMREALSGHLLSNPVRLTSFLDAATKAITLDTGTSFADLQALATSLQGLDPSHVTFYTSPIESEDYSPPGTDVTGKVQLDPVLGRALYNDVINNASPTTPTPTSATGTTDTASASDPSTSDSSASTGSSSKQLQGISASDASCTL